MANDRPPRYEQRLILFLDFLGFREVVDQTVTDSESLPRLIRAMDALGDIGDEEVFKSQKVTQFSDSIVLSYSVKERSAVFWLLTDIALRVVTLVGHGYLLRGAVTVGELYHTDQHMVGPAMIAAYEMESKHAIYPRVLIDPSLISVARMSRSEIHSPDDEEEYVRHFMTQDIDGRYYFDYVSWRSVVEVTGGDDDGYPEHLAQIGKLIERGLGHSCARVLEKYLWLYDKYLAAITQFEDLPAAHPYRAQSPEACHAIEQLSKFDKLVKVAREAVTDARAGEKQPKSALRKC